MRMPLDLDDIEQQLKKRWAYPYKWFQKQNDTWDAATRFIYKHPDWEATIAQLEIVWKAYQFDKASFFYYAINRWYNFWSAQAVEQLFTDLPGVAPNPKPLEDQYDFRWLGEPFDHKTSVFPKGFEGEYAFAKAHPEKLLHWFYKNQSTGQRHHLKNRIFVVCHAADGYHFKLKAEITLLQNAIATYMKDRTPADTHRLALEPGHTTLADIIWVTR